MMRCRKGLFLVAALLFLGCGDNQVSVGVAAVAECDSSKVLVTPTASRKWCAFCHTADRSGTRFRDPGGSSVVVRVVNGYSGLSDPRIDGTALSYGIASGADTSWGFRTYEGALKGLVGR